MSLNFSKDQLFLSNIFIKSKKKYISQIEIEARRLRFYMIHGNHQRYKAQDGFIYYLLFYTIIMLYDKTEEFIFNNK